MQKKTPWPLRVLGILLLAAFLCCIGVFVFADMKEGALRWGYVDVQGTEVISPRFEAARRFQNGRAAAQEDGLWGWIDKEGSWAVPPRYARLCDFQPELSCARDPETRQWGYIDHTGAWAIEPQFDVAYDMEGGVAPVGRGVSRSSATGEWRNHFGLVAADGTMVAPIRPEGDPEAWTSVRVGSEGLFPTARGRKWGYVDTTGAWVIDPRFGAAKSFRDGHAAVSVGAWAVIDRDGEVVVPPGHGLADGASEGLIAGPGGYFDLGGTPVGPRYEWVRLHRGGLGAVNAKKAWGFVDTEGELVIPLSFPRVSEFDGTAAFAAAVDGLDYRWGVVGRDGSWTAQPRWTKADETGFHEGLGVVAR